MLLNKDTHYVYRIGSDNQYRLFWSEGAWHYEFLAGGVLFDDQTFPTEADLSEGLSAQGMSLDQFSPDIEKKSAAYSAAVREKIRDLERRGVAPCPKHGLSAKNIDGTCEACQNQDYPDDFKGTEG